MSDQPKTGRGKHRTPRPPLSAREARFCARYAEHGNITRAHAEAGFEAAGDNAHAVAGRSLLRKAQIRAHIRLLQAEALDASRVTVDRIAQGLARLAFADRADLYDDQGRLLPPKDWPADVRGCVEGVESEEVYAKAAKGKPKKLVGHVKKVKTGRRAEALKTLAQWRKMVGHDGELAEMAAEIGRLRTLVGSLYAEQGGAAGGAEGAGP